MITTRYGLLRGATVAASLLVAMFALPAVALAANTPIALDAPDNGTSPLVAYAPDDGYTYVAWSAPGNQNGGNGVDLCILVAGTSGCEGGAPVLLTDTNTSSAGLGTNSANTVGVGGLVVLPGSGEVVVLGTPVSSGTVAWASPPGGSAFLTGDNGLQDAGALISPVSMFYTTNNAVALNGSDVGLFDSYDHFYSYFSDTPFAGPLTPATLPSNAGNANNGGSFDDQKEATIGPVIAAEPAPAPAAAGSVIVVGVGANLGVNENQPTPAGCLNSAATGYGVTVGTTGASGTLNSQGLQQSGFSLLACSAETPVLASGGQDGIGVLEQEGNGIDGAGSDYALDFRPFDVNATATGGSFGAPVQLQDVTKVSLGGAGNLDLADDSGTGVYASWEDGQGLVLDYSPNGGASWNGPVTVPELSNGASQGDPVIAGVGAGGVEIAYDNNLGTGTQVYLQVIDLATAPTSVTTTQSSGSKAAADLSIAGGTIGETDKATVSGDYATGATGSMTYDLYSSSTCSAASQVYQRLTSVSGGVAAAATLTSVLPAGKYYWKASYSGFGDNAPSVSACGSEVLTVNPAAVASTGATSNGSSVSITISCASIPCTLSVTITSDPPPAADARAGDKRKAPKIITLATGTFKLRKHGRSKLAIRLTSAGKSLLIKDHGHLTASIALGVKTRHGIARSSGTLKISTPRH